jgi:hypothetical protein
MILESLKLFIFLKIKQKTSKGIFCNSISTNNIDKLTI